MAELIENIASENKLSVEKGKTLCDVPNNNVPEPVNNNLANGHNESDNIYSTFTDPNFIQNLPCSNDIKNSTNHISAISDDNLLNVNFNAEISIGSDCLNSTDYSSGSNVSRNSFTGVCSLSEKTLIEDIDLPDTVDRPVLEQGPTDAFDFLESNLMDTSEEKGKIIENFLNQEENEVFQDAQEFFKDPSNIQFLENINTSNQINVVRDSLYTKFDPLHALNTQSEKLPKLSEEISQVENTLEIIVATEGNLQTSAEETLQIESTSEIIEVPEVKAVSLNDTLVNKHNPNRESCSNILISFDSPLKTNCMQDTQLSETPSKIVPSKLYTEEEFQHKLKDHELMTQERYLKRQKEFEDDAFKKIKEKDEKINLLSSLSENLHLVIVELSALIVSLKNENEAMVARIGELESENKSLESAVKISSEDCQNVETTFSDFHKRYMQSKEIIKVYKSNEDCFKMEIETLQKKLNEQEDLHTKLQEKMKEIVDKANSEVCKAKKGDVAQIAVLQAQLKKSELKVSSLESDLKQMRLQNDNLSSICDDLMAKVSAS